MDVIKCTHCGKDLPKESQFCPYCMERINEPKTVTLLQEEKILDKKTIVILASAIAVVLVLNICAVVSIFAKDKSNVSSETSTTSTTATTESNEENSTSSQETETNDVEVNGSVEDNTTTNANVENVIVDEGLIFGEEADDYIFGEEADDYYDVNDANGSSKNNGASIKETTTKKATATTKPAPETTTKPVTTTKPTQTTTSKMEHECLHNWIAITETVYHDEVGHYEDVQVQRPVKKVECPVCYECFDTVNAYYDHFDSAHKPSYDGDPIKAMRNQYTMANDFEYYTEKEWVVDEEAYREEVINGYKCAYCGEKK